MAELPGSEGWDQPREVQVTSDGASHWWGTPG